MQSTLPFHATSRQSRQTFAERAADLFRSRPDCWIDGREFSTLVGCYGWRTRISDCRRSPFFMVIENRQRRVTLADGSHYIVSEYCWRPQVRAAEGAADGVSPSPAAV